MVELWQVLAVLIPVLVAVLAAYGGLIKKNDGRIEDNRANHDKLKGRLYGEDRGNSGEINEIKNDIERLETETLEQLNDIQDRQMEIVTAVKNEQERLKLDLFGDERDPTRPGLFKQTHEISTSLERIEEMLEKAGSQRRENREDLNDLNEKVDEIIEALNDSSDVDDVDLEP